MKLFDPFMIKQLFDSAGWGVETIGEVGSMVKVLQELRRSVLPLPLIDRRKPMNADIFPEFKAEQLPFFANKKIGLVCSGGSGALVSLCGVKRALEEAGAAIGAVSICSGSALWGTLIASGFSAQQMVDFSFALEPRLYVDLDLLANACRIANRFKGFTGLVAGQRIEDHYDRALNSALIQDVPIPLFSIVYNLDLGRVEYFGTGLTPSISVAKLVRVAIALPLFVESVKVGEHYYMDGGIINVFPVEPLLKHVPDLDFIIGVNCILPPDFVGENHSGWCDRPFSILPASRQLRFGQWVELARLNRDMARDKILVLNPLPFTEIRGIKFYRYFVDKLLWPEAILTAYRYTKEKVRQLA